MYSHSLINGSENIKPLGTYLVDAGLLSPGQVEVILTDQQFTLLSFGEIATARGWVKQQTVEYLMDKVIVPERTAQEKSLVNSARFSRKSTQEQYVDFLKRPSEHFQAAHAPSALPLPSGASSQEPLPQAASEDLAECMNRRQSPHLPEPTLADEIKWVG
jgi:hypothetical protein